MDPRRNEQWSYARSEATSRMLLVIAVGDMLLSVASLLVLSHLKEGRRGPEEEGGEGEEAEDQTEGG